MQISNLKILCDLVETKNFSKAAKLNGITQSAVSQQMQSMERRFRTLLIDRTQKRLSLTPEGQIAYKAAREIMHTYAKFLGELSEFNSVTSGTIRISSIYSIGLHVLHPHLQQFETTYPSVKLQINYRRAATIYEDVFEGVADFGFVAYPAKTRQIEITPFMMDQLVLIMSPSHPFAQKSTPLNIRSLSGQKFVGFDPKAPTRKAIDQIFEKHKVNVDLAMEFDNIETVKRAVQIAHGMALVPLSCVAAEEAAGTLIVKQFDGPEYKRPLAILTRKGRSFSPAMTKFMEHLTSKTAAAAAAAAVDTESSALE